MRFCLIFLVLLLEVLFADLSWGKCIVDTEGRRVCVSRKPERIVVLTGTCVETIYILGEIERVVGISRNMLENPFYSEIIGRLKEIPVVAQDMRNLDLEKIISLKPDLLIALGPEHPYGLRGEMVKKIESLGLPLILTNLESLSENYYSIEILGELFEKRSMAMRLIEHMKKIERHVRSKVSKIPENTRVRAIMLSHRPTLVLAGLWGKEDIIALSGGINVAGSIREFITEVSLERIASWDPEVVTIVGTANYDPDLILSSPQWRDIKAVKTKRVFKYPYQLTGIFTPRVPLLLAWCSSKFYPDLKIDWVGICDEFFRRFYSRPYYGPRN